MNAPLVTILLAAFTVSLPAQQPPPGRIHILVDTRLARHAISPLIYGVNYATTSQLQQLRAPVNRSGGDSATTFNFEQNARSSARDFFFESTPAATDILQQYGDTFVDLSQRAAAAVILTIPMVGWIAKLGPNGTRLDGFSVAKYGPQQATDKSGFTDAGNGLTPDGKPIPNDPNDAMQPDSLDRETRWMRRNFARWQPASHGGIQFYALDNEPARWHDIHRDVHPIGTHATEIAAKSILFGNMVHAVDPSAKVLAPEEWLPIGALKSGFDQQIDETKSTAAPDRRTETGGRDLLPWLLTQWQRAGKPVDIVSVHYYPQLGEYSQDVSEPIELLRNRSTRALWDRNFHDIPWIAGNTALLPSLRQTVDRFYIPGIPIALTEYSWGAENFMNGATTQGDLLGIFGRENLYLATRWIAPEENSPTFLAMKLFRNYDDHGGSFGDLSVSASVPDPDTLSAFAALRSSDHAVTVLLINKQLHQPAKVAVSLAGIAPQGSFETIQLAAGKLVSLAAQGYRHASIQTVLPPQSVTLLVVHAHSG